MILKFWPRRPRKWPLNRSSLGGCPVDFIQNYIFEISGLHWSKWAIACLIWKTFIFQICYQPRRLDVENLKNESFVWPRRPRRPRKELGEYFQRLHFWNQWVPLIKTQCRVRYLLDFDLKLRSGQGCLMQKSGICSLHLLTLTINNWQVIV